MTLGPLYHWSPRTRLKSITRLGLVPGKPRVAPTEGDDKDDGFRQDSVCLSLDPLTAWTYSHAVFKVPGTYDLWLVRLDSTDEVHVLPSWGGRITEVRVRNRIPKSRLVWIGERTLAPVRAKA